MSTLVITLPLGSPAPATEYRYVLSADGRSVTRHASAPAALLPAPGRAGATVAVVPAQALSWHQVTLPAAVLGQPARLRAALEGLLEEQLLDEPQQLHFALQPGAQAASPAWVAVCDRDWLRQWLQALEAAGRPVGRVVPEFAPGAGAPLEYTVLGTPEQAHVAITGCGPQQALYLLPAAALPAMAALLPQQSEEAPAPLYAEPAVAALAERLLGRSPQLQGAAQRALAAAGSPWDLAQFDLASSARTRALRKAGSALGDFLHAPAWRPARWALGLGLAAQVLGLNLWAWQDRQALAAKQASVRQVLTQTFPQVKVVVDAPLQMQREVDRLRRATGSLANTDLEPLMASAAAALPGAKTPARLDYANGELRLGGLDLAPDEFAGLRQRLGAAGIEARQDQGALQLHAGIQP